MLYVIYVTRLHLYFFCCSLDYITRLLIYRYSIVSGGCLIHFRLCCLHRVIIHSETGLASMVYKFFDKKSSGSGVAALLANKSATELNYQLANKLHR